MSKSIVMIEQLTIKQAIKRYNKSDSTIRRLLRDMSENDRDKYLSTDGSGRNLISTIYLDKVYKRQTIEVVDYQLSQSIITDAAIRFAQMTDQYERLLIEQQEQTRIAQERYVNAMAKLEQVAEAVVRLIDISSMSDDGTVDEPVTESKPKKKKKKGKKKKSNKKSKNLSYGEWLQKQKKPKKKK